MPNYANNYVPIDKIKNFSKDIINSEQFSEYSKKINIDTYIFDPWNCYGFSQVSDILSKKKFIYCSMITNNHHTYDKLSRIKIKFFSLFKINQNKIKITHYNKSKNQKFRLFFVCW